MAAETFVGRKAHVNAIEAACTAAAGGAPQLVLVTGEPGMGKSTMLERAARRLSGWTVLRAIGDETESDHPLAMVGQLTGATLRTDEPMPDAMAAGADLLAFLGDRQDDGPLAVLVDDAQWADVPSLAALGFALRRLRVDRVVTLLACRSESLHRLPTGLRRLAEGPRGTIVDLQGLTVPRIRELAKLRTGRPLDAVAATRLREHTRGSPLHVTALLDEIDPARLREDKPLPAPRELAPLVLSRLAECSRDTEAIVVAASVLGHAAPLGRVAALAGVAEPWPAVDQAVRVDLARVVDEQGDRRFVFSHPLVRSSVYHDLSPARRADLHTRAAELLAADELAAIRHRLAASAGGDDALANQVAPIAARQIDRGALATAASLLLEGARVGNPGPMRERRVLGAAECRLLDGDLAGLAQLRPRLEGFADTARRAYLLGRLALVEGRRDDAAQLLDRAWAGATDGGPEHNDALAARIAGQQATLAVQRGRGQQAVAWAARAIDLDPRGTAASANPAMMLAMGLAIDGRLADGVEGMTALIDDGLRAGAAHADALLGRGVLRLWRHELPEAVADLEQVIALCRGKGPFQTLETARYYLADARWRGGDWDGAIVLAESVASTVDDADHTWISALPHAIASMPLAARGEWDQAAAHVAAAFDAAEAVGGVAPRLWAVVAGARLAEARGDHQAVVDALEPLTKRRQQIEEGVAYWRPMLVEALAAVGRIDDAKEVLSGLSSDTSRSANVLVRLDLARARATVLARSGDAAAGGELAAEALLVEGDHGASAPFSRARLALVAGGLLRRAGKRRAAAVLLREAHEAFARLGSAPWLERCESELGDATSGPTTRGAAGDGLTRQEAAVARLAATGLTNREVAAELVLSTKTVEHHLSRAYAKLGVRSRTELAVRLSATSPTDTPA